MRYFASLASAIAVAAAAPALAQEPVELIYNSYLPPFNETFQVGIRDFAAAIQEESGGTITVTIPDTSLAPSERQYEMVRDGIADMAVVNMDNVSQLVTLNGLAELPGMAPTSEAGSVALWETYNEFFAPLNEFEGVVVLSTHVLPGRQILSVGDRAPATPEDLRGAKIWATSAPLIASAEAFGGVPIVTSFGELQEFTTKGNLDLVFITPGSADGAGILPNVTHITEVPGGLGSVAFAIFINEDRWNALSDDQRAAILRAAEGLPRRLGEANDASEEAVAEAVAQIPTTVVEGEAADAFAAVLSPQIEAWMERAREAGLEDPQAAIDFYRSVLERETAAEG